MLEHVFMNASNALSGPAARRMNSIMLNKLYVIYNNCPVEENRPPSFSTEGPVVSVDARLWPLIPRAGRTDTTSTSIPMPPSQFDMALHIMRPLGIVSRTMTVQPVVVKPAVDSKRDCINE